MQDKTTPGGHQATNPSDGARVWRVAELESVDSTQAEATRRIAAGERGPLWIRADAQTQGRGRSGRDWATLHGNFAATLVLTPDCDVVLLPQLSLLAGIAVADTVNAALESRAPDAGLPPVRASLKWPNDLLIGPAKLGGILVETSIVGHTAMALIGIGVNLLSAPDVSGRAVTRLSSHAPSPPDASTFLAALAPVMAHWLDIWSRGQNFTAVRAAWLDRATAPGAPISVNAGEGPVEGSFGGLDTDGALLLLEPSGRRRRFSWGDVTLRPVKV